MKRRLVPVLVLCGSALLAGPPGAPRGTQAAGEGSADDAYHFASWADGRHDGSYTEWWYFNLFDSTSGAQAIVSYFVANPADLGGTERVQMAAVAYTSRGVVSEVDDFPADAFSADATRADVSIGGNTLRAVDDASYRVAGASRDGRLAWDLTYRRAAEPWFAADRMTIGSFPWERMSWLVDMPRAEVTGTLTVDGRDYDIRAAGYHDHNWGEWIPTDGLWNWAQHSEEGLTLEVGDFIGKPAGLCAVDAGGTRSVFTKDQYSLVHTRYWFDFENRVVYPIESLLTADDGALRLQVTIRALRTEPLRGDLPFPLRDLIVYEQTARYDGTLWTKDAAGDWIVASVIHGDGFKEYTARRY